MTPCMVNQEKSRLIHYITFMCTLSFTEIPLTVCALSQLVPVSHSKEVLSLSCVAELRLQERKHSDVVFLFPGEFLTAQT